MFTRERRHPHFPEAHGQYAYSAPEERYRPKPEFCFRKKADKKNTLTDKLIDFLAFVVDK